jgi:AraC-like DNA-binding protein
MTWTKMATLFGQLAADRSSLSEMVAHFTLLEPVFDAMPDIAFFIKDTESRYVLANLTLAQRCGFKDKHALFGKTAEQVFPPRFGHIYAVQDKSILTSGRKIIDQLELHLYPGRRPGWCLTCKLPLFGSDGHVAGIAGISRDLHAPEATHPAYSRLAAAVRHIQDNYSQPLQLSQLARIADMSVAQIERYFHKVFHLTPRQILLKARLDAASALLAGDTSITEIAALCGYHDHSAFSRQFKTTVGSTPGEYRALLRTLAQSSSPFDLVATA